jgi:hypothetical protein
VDLRFEATHLKERRKYLPYYSNLVLEELSAGLFHGTVSKRCGGSETSNGTGHSGNGGKGELHLELDNKIVYEQRRRYVSGT